MKKIYTYLMTALLCAGLFACESEASYPVPVALDPAGISAEALPGAIKLKWTIPANADYKFVKVTFDLPLDEGGVQACTRMASVYSDTLLIDGLLARYGDIQFTFQTCSPDGKGGETHSLTSRALPATKTFVYESADLAPVAYWTDNQEKSEGPLADLFDNNAGTFFHMSWQTPTPWPHYIVVDMGKELRFFNFSYTCRNNANCDNPSAMDILVSNDPITGAPDYATEAGTTLLASLTGLPNSKAATYESQTISSDVPFRYIWFKILGSTSSKNWVAMSILNFRQVSRYVYDPETGETTVE